MSTTPGIDPDELLEADLDALPVQTSGEFVECPECGWTSGGTEEFDFAFVEYGNGSLVSIVRCEECETLWRDDR